MGDMPDLSSLMGMLNEKGIDLNTIMQNFSNTNNSSNGNLSNDTSNMNNRSTFTSSNMSGGKSTTQNFDTSNQQFSNNSQMPDMETMMKIMKIMNSINSNTNNPSANLLYSLKPFLRESKKEKIDQYVNFLKISSVISEINKSGGDSK